MNAIVYQQPDKFLKYRANELIENLTGAKAAVMALKAMPYQRRWVDELQEMQLKREVAGTSRIEGAEFTDSELDQAMQDSPEQLLTRSQKQAAACKKTYLWIGDLQDDRPVDRELIIKVHTHIVTGADDDHCPPGQLRDSDHNVTFGSPRHRGVNGGQECEAAFNALCDSISAEFKQHDQLIQALALHYHLAAMHPFADGNGRSARALEALVLQRCGLKDTLFIAMSNYYYEEKNNYLSSLAKVRAENHDLTEFLNFGLKGIMLQCTRLTNIIKKEVKKALFRDVMHDLFGRMKTKRKRVIAKRQVEILNVLLESNYEFGDLWDKCDPLYVGLKAPDKAFVRDFVQLDRYGAIQVRREDQQVAINLDWPTQITETEFYAKSQQLPMAKTGAFGPGIAMPSRTKDV